MANIGYIQVNRHCNNACHFCSNPSNGQNISYEKGIELIDDFIQRGYRGVIFTWWEPTLSPDLPRWLTYCVENGIENRIISNGMMCATPDYMKRLADSGLQMVHFSVYSCYEKVHDFLTDTPWSWQKLVKSISNALHNHINVQINMVINHYNENHLDKTVQFLVKYFPQVPHFVWNNLDPLMMRKTSVAESTLPDFDSFKPSLRKAMDILYTSGKTFRVERVPLCYMRPYEFFSTETRKIVKDEERIVHFLDERSTVVQKWIWFEHDKLEGCKDCSLNPICAWIYEYEKFFPNVKVYPQKLTAEERKTIVSRVLGTKYT